MAHELCVKTAPAVSGPFFWRFCTSHVGAPTPWSSWAWARWWPLARREPPPLHQNRRCPGWYMTLDGPPPEEALRPAVLGMPRGQKRLNGRFWGHCVGEAVGAPRTAGARASSGGGPPRVIYHPGQRWFWCNGGGALRARGQGPTLLSSETPQTSSCGEAGARKISGVCRPFRDPSCLPRLPNMLN